MERAIEEEIKECIERKHTVRLTEILADEFLKDNIVYTLTSNPNSRGILIEKNNELKKYGRSYISEFVYENVGYSASRELVNKVIRRIKKLTMITEYNLIQKIKSNGGTVWVK